MGIGGMPDTRLKLELVPNSGVQVPRIFGQTPRKSGAVSDKVRSNQRGALIAHREVVRMRRSKWLVAVSLICLSGCAPFVLAPGAADVRLTKVAADVVGCTAVGNIQLPRDSDGFELRNAVGRLRNQTIGLGGNAALVTESVHGTPTTGVAYRCPSRSGS